MYGNMRVTVKVRAALYTLASIFLTRVKLKLRDSGNSPFRYPKSLKTPRYSIRFTSKAGTENPIFCISASSWPLST